MEIYEGCSTYSNGELVFIKYLNRLLQLSTPDEDFENSFALSNENSVNYIILILLYSLLLTKTVLRVFSEIVC